MDDFFTKKNCDRCGKPLTKGRIMSMLNTDCICLECKAKEQAHPRYEEAKRAELEELKKGNYNYAGLFEQGRITDKLYEQILAIRDLGICNMFDIAQVQREAFNRDFHELVILIEENKEAYLQFVLHGQR